MSQTKNSAVHRQNLPLRFSPLHACVGEVDGDADFAAGTDAESGGGSVVSVAGVSRKRGSFGKDDRQ